MIDGSSTTRAARAPSAAATLSRALIAFESEDAARLRLAAFGYPPDVAAEIAVYLAQSTDLPLFIDDITQALSREGIAAEFVALDELPQRLRRIGAAERPDDRMGVHRWRALLSRLVGSRSRPPRGLRAVRQPRRGGASVPGQIREPRTRFRRRPRRAATRLMEGEAEIAALGDWAASSGPLFVKPNTLGAKIGIFADSLCRDRAEANDRAKRIWERYRDRALIQAFIEGDDVRVSFMDLGGEFADQLGVERIVKDPASDAGGAFLTMKDNETLSGARDTAGGRGGFGASRAAAFTPRMVDLRGEDDERSRRAVALIQDFSARLARLIGLRDLFSIDFRIDANGRPTFFEFEVCPGVTIYDFQNYLSRRGVTLGGGLAKAMRLAFEGRGSMSEA